jgi:outer membrane protein assembly factor BamA
MMKRPIIFLLEICTLIFFCAVGSPDTLAQQDSALVVKEVVVHGNTITREFVIRREMSLMAGVVLTQERIDRDRNQIYNLGLFNRVEIDYTEQDSGAIVIVTVDERWYLFPFPVIGMRYRDIKNLYYGAGIVHQNFRGRNEKVFASLVFGYDRWFNLVYQNPKITDDDDIFLTANLTLQRMHSLSPNDAMYLNTNISAWGSVGKRFGIHQMVSLSAGYEVWQVSNPGLGRTASASGRDAFVSAGAAYRFDTRNIREYPTSGTFIQLSVTKNGLGNQAVDITNVIEDSRFYIGLWEWAGLALRAKTNMTWGGVIPPYRKAYFGYDDRIRGYFNKKIESENTALASVEIRLPILAPRYFEAEFIKIPQFRMLRYGLYFGLFADAGRAWNRDQVALGGHWKSGVGGGLHFLLPYGFTVRTEVAVNDNGNGEAFIDFDVAF